MMKLLLTVSVFIFFVGCTNYAEEKVYMFSYFKNNGECGLHLAYSEDGYLWKALNNNESFLKPAAGNDKLMRDPCIIVGGDGKFHMVWTVSWNEQGIGYAWSEDLINWSEQLYIPVMEHEPEALNCWAPELYYDAVNDQYMIHWATTIPGRFDEGEGRGDGIYNHRMYYTLTRDFKKFSQAEILYDHGFNVIDANIHKINDDFVMFLKDETRWPEAEKNIRIATSESLTGPYSPPSDPITGNWVEGPTAIKIDGYWIVYFDKYTEGVMGAVKSKDLSNWTDISDIVSFPEGTRHGTVFTVNRSLLDKLLLVDSPVACK